MRKGMFITAYDRPDYLQRVLDSWGYVRELRDWHVVARIEPGPQAEAITEMFNGFRVGARHKNFDIIVNPKRYGVLHHPWVGFEEMFETCDFVVRAEDDLMVSNDILELMSWMAERFASDPTVATVHGYTEASGEDSEVTYSDGFQPWVWGTWKDRWQEFIRDTWDHDYSTYNHFPGNQAGWDWNLNTRIFPARGARAVYPLSSRVDNIGVHGTHATPEVFVTSPSFRQSYESGDYRLVTP